MSKEYHKVDSDDQLFTAVETIVEDNFYMDNQVSDFKSGSQILAQMPDQSALASPQSIDDRISIYLASLHDGHTFRRTQDQSSYYEMLDIFNFAIDSSDQKRLFPPNGTVFYYGIGLVGQQIDGKVYVSKLYDGYPAAQSDLKLGDELISIDGASSLLEPVFKAQMPFTKITYRRTKNSAPQTTRVPVVKIKPQYMFLDASLQSERIISKAGHHIGYMRVWSGTNSDVFRALETHLSTGSLANVDGLILDLRGRWGGASPQDANIFVNHLGKMEMVLKEGVSVLQPARWTKPVIALIDEGTRSGLEIFAYNLKKNGIPLLGANTHGAINAATLYLLPDDSALMLSVGYTQLDGHNYDGIGIAPDEPVSINLPYAAGHDEQLEQAIARMQKQLAQMSNTDLKS